MVHNTVFWYTNPLESGPAPPVGRAHPRQVPCARTAIPEPSRARARPSVAPRPHRLAQLSRTGAYELFIVGKRDKFLSIVSLTDILKTVFSPTVQYIQQMLRSKPPVVPVGHSRDLSSVLDTMNRGVSRGGRGPGAASRARAPARGGSLWGGHGNDPHWTATRLCGRRGALPNADVHERSPGAQRTFRGGL